MTYSTHVRRSAAVAVTASCLLAAVLMTAAPAAAARVWWVDRNNPSCVDGNVGSQAVPFCTISRGAKKALAGDTVMVEPGIYREQVTPSSTGALGAPITFQADGLGVIVQGTKDLSDPDGAWSAAAGNAWQVPLAAAPKQVFVDGVGLANATLSSVGSTANSWAYDATNLLLLANTDGSNPAVGRDVEASTISYGFSLSGKSYVVVDGFTVRYQAAYGVRVSGGSGHLLRHLTITRTFGPGVYLYTGATNVTVADSEVSFAKNRGIKLSGVSSIQILRNVVHDNADHGISLSSADGNLIEGNESYANVYPTKRAAVGIDVYNSDNNVVRGNTLHDNQDSGMNTRSGSLDNLVVRNISYHNGDHGFDTVGSALRTRYVSDTSFGNYKDGFSIEGGATGTTVYDCIGVDNGLTTGEYDLWVSTDAYPGFFSDRNLWWDSVAGYSIRVNGSSYLSLTKFRAATPFEDFGVDGDPRFVNAIIGNLHLSAGSPAIDAADSSVSGFADPDHDGVGLFDDPGTTNTGAGSPAYADLGALEFVAA